ncbi:calcium/sodium antiporter [Aestuariibacter halophilus]|uniref:Calcium/sodium antiporter n=1 Tax=Fluctibacter halophilus TaxID=226011 RepID=A0ABS8GB78_9ALTE|nr:calcium/sodium antiporter [Aestuariibacter halophilus]MCC2617845.1 calcium/sodium antiporter [Aestuariibacter halophilus]
MITDIVIFLIGLGLLSWGADRFVYGASALAKNIGISPMMIGLTIVAMGSSAPEIVVSATASMAGNPNTAVGNALGSNITNIALVLGLTALFKPLMVNSSTLRREMPVLLLVTLLAVYFLSDSLLSLVEGSTLIVLFFVVIGGVAWISTNIEKGDPILAETEEEIPSDVPTSKAVLWVIVGLIMLPLSANLMVDSAVSIAQFFGLSELVIGLTIIAIGTSLPELAASIAGVLKNEDDLALGNIIGSNIFNLLAVLAMPGLISPGVIDEAAANRDSYAMLGLTILLILFSFNLRGTRCINRWEGGVLLACFAGYQVLLFS